MTESLIGNAVTVVTLADPGDDWVHFLGIYK